MPEFRSALRHGSSRFSEVSRSGLPVGTGMLAEAIADSVDCADGVIELWFENRSFVKLVRYTDPLNRPEREAPLEVE